MENQSNRSHTMSALRKYLTEFIMIFLAVTLGFFADNFRERISERQLGKEYVRSLREDLVKDIASIDEVVHILEGNIESCDSLVNLLRKNTLTASDLEHMYMANITSLRGFGLTLTDRTSSLLKNSGGIHFIGDKEVTSAMLDYWQNGELTKNLIVTLTTMRIHARDESYSIFDSKYYYRTNINGADNRLKVSPDAKLMKVNDVALTEFANRIQHFSRTMSGPSLSAILNQRKLAKELIDKIDQSNE